MKSGSCITCMFIVDFHNDTIYIRDIYVYNAPCTSSLANTIQDVDLKSHSVRNISDNIKCTTNTHINFHRARKLSIVESQERKHSNI